MSSTISLAIGKESSGQDFIVDLTALPHLFISYSHDFQLPSIFISLFQQMIVPELDIQFGLSFNSKLAIPVQTIIPGQKIFCQFLHSDFREGQVNSIDEFLHELKLERKKRKQLFRKSKAVAEKIPAIVVCIDDIFEVFKSKNRKSAIGLLELLLDAAQYKMYFILGSAGIYRGLLDEVIKVNPSLKKKIDEVMLSSKISQLLGAELVINPDGLLFFREKDEKIHKRLYPGPVLEADV